MKIKTPLGTTELQVGGVSRRAKNIGWMVLGFAPLAILLLACFLFTNQDVAVITGAIK